MNTVSKKKTLLSCLLAACMGLSAFAGGLLLKADAAELQVQSAALFTASEGVNVRPASQYQKADGTSVGSTGLRFQSTNDEAFTIQLNGVFHRSFGLDWSAPADGWIDGGAEVVFEIAEFGNPDNKFEIHYKGLWQSSAWVEYDYTDSNGDTQTLYRTYGLGYQGTSRMVYSKDIIDGSVNSPDGSDILFSPMLTANESVTDRRFSRTEVRVQNSLTDATAGSTATDGAVVNVVGWSNGGGTVPIASFRDDPESFSPTDAEMEVYAVQQWWDPSGDANYNIGYNLPRINFDNGYTVKIHVSKGLEFMVFSIGEIMDNDYNNYWTNEPFNTWPAMQVDTTGEQAQCADEANAATYWSTVSFYQKWQAVPFIEVEDHDEYVAAGQVITPPEATYATNGNPTATNPVTDIQYRVNGGAWSAVPADGIPACATGDDVEVLYTANVNGKTITETITLRVRSKASDLVTVTNGATVTAAKSYTTSAGDYTTPAGLYISAPSDKSLSYGVELNGIFTGSTGIKAYFPGEGFWEATRETVITVASAVDPEEKFQVHIGGRYQSYGYVTYDWNGETLYRTVNSYEGNDTYYYQESNVKDIGAAQYLPVQGHLSDTDLGRREPYIGFEMQTDGTFNVVLISSHNAGVRKTIASFCEQRTTFEPTTEASGTAPNLPKLDLSKGYTISIENSDNDDAKSFDLLIESIATSETGDPYAGGTVYALNGAGVEQEPEFYKQWLTFPSITIGQYDKIVAAGDLTAPKATYTTNGDPSAKNSVEKIEYRIDGGSGWTSAAAGLIPGLKSGNEVEVRYSVSWNGLTISESITFSVRNLEAFAAQEVVNVKEPTVKVTANGQGASGEKQSENGLLLEPTIEQSYSFDFVGRFTGNTEFRWGTAAEEGWSVNGRVEFTVAEAGNPENYFKVVWLSPDQTRAYVEYVYNGTTLYCAQGRNNSGTYYYVLGTGEDHNKDDIADNWDIQYQPWIGDASSSGVLGLEWNGDVLNVMATNESGNKQILASFVNDLDGFTPATEGTGSKSNLPKISFANGYTVSVKVTGAIDFLLYDVTTEEGEISFDTETVAYEPLWYTRGTAMPVFDDIPVLPGVQVGSDTQFTVPELTYTASKDAKLTVAWVKPDNSESATQPGGTLSMTDKGDHILRYTVTADGVPYVKELTVHVCDYATFVSGKPATCISEGEGLFTCVHGNALERVVPADENAHSVSYNEQINPTCTTEGVRACWECLYCHKYFADADCAEELTDLSLPIDPDAHTYWAKWTWDGETPSVEFYCKDCDAEAECTEEIKVVESEEESVDATCQTEGKKVLEASVVFGGYRYIDLHEAVIPVAPHALTAVAEKPSTCMQEGTKAYYICSVCGKLFLDAEGKTETSKEEIVIPTGGHQLKEVPAKESTCAEAGNKAYWECSICGKLFLDAEGKTETSKEEVALPTSGQHNMVQVPAKAPTCTEDGNSAYYKCSECGRCTSDDKGEMEIDESSMKLPAAGHKFEGGVCTVCGAEDPGDGASDGLTGGQIAAIVVAAVVVAAGVVVAVVLVVRKKKLGGQK